jgi:hypothetical protein
VSQREAQLIIRSTENVSWFVVIGKSLGYDA